MFEMSVVSIPLPPAGKGMETLFKQLRAVFSPSWQSAGGKHPGPPPVTAGQTDYQLQEK